MNRKMMILCVLPLLLWLSSGSHLRGENDPVDWMFPTSNLVGEIRSQISYEYEKDGSIMTLKVNLPIHADGAGYANSVWWLKVKSGEKGAIADFLNSPTDGIEVSIGRTGSKLVVNNEKINFLRTFMERYPKIFKNQLASGNYTTGDLGDKKDKFEKEYRKHKFFNISPMVWSAEFGLNYSALDYIQLTDASYSEESNQKWGLVGRGTLGIFLKPNKMLGFTMAYEKKWKKPESKDSLPEGFPIPMKWLSGPTYFEGLVKEEKIELVVEYKQYLGNCFGLNPGVKVGSFLPGALDKNYFYTGFLGVYFSPKDESFSIGVKVAYEYLKSKDEGKPSLSLFLSKAFGLK